MIEARRLSPHALKAGNPPPPSNPHGRSLLEAPYVEFDVAIAVSNWHVARYMGEASAP